MKFNEIKEAATNGNNIVICKCASGWSYSYENTEFVKETASGNLVFKTQSGSKFQVKDVYGQYKLTSKASMCFIKLESELSDNAFKSIIL